MAKEKTAVYFQPETMRKIEQEYKDDLESLHIG